MILRDKIKESDLLRIREILSSTGFFEQAPDEIDVAVSLAVSAINEGNNLENYKFIFADRGEKTIGYICFARVPCSVSTVEIYWLGVDKSFQGKGIGRKLIEEVVSLAFKQGYGKVILYTAGRKQYESTHFFYKACGFKEEARIKDYYAKDDDCVIYSIEMPVKSS